jgi:hypothetical protein
MAGRLLPQFDGARKTGRGETSWPPARWSSSSCYGTQGKTWFLPTRSRSREGFILQTYGGKNDPLEAGNEVAAWPVPVDVGGLRRRSSSSKKPSGRFTAGSSTSSQASIAVSRGGRWRETVVARVLGFHTLWDKIQMI